MTKKKIKTAKGTERVYEKNIYTRFNSSGQAIETGDLEKAEQEMKVFNRRMKLMLEKK